VAAQSASCTLRTPFCISQRVFQCLAGDVERWYAFSCALGREGQEGKRSKMTVMRMKRSAHAAVRRVTDVPYHRIGKAMP